MSLPLANGWTRVTSPDIFPAKAKAVPFAVLQQDDLAINDRGTDEANC